MNLIAETATILLDKSQEDAAKGFIESFYDSNRSSKMWSRVASLSDLIRDLRLIAEKATLHANLSSFFESMFLDAIANNSHLLQGTTEMRQIVYDRASRAFNIPVTSDSTSTPTADASDNRACLAERMKKVHSDHLNSAPQDCLPLSQELLDLCGATHEIIHTEGNVATRFRLTRAFTNYRAKRDFGVRCQANGVQTAGYLKNQGLNNEAFIRQVKCRYVKSTTAKTKCGYPVIEHYYTNRGIILIYEPLDLSHAHAADSVPRGVSNDIDDLIEELTAAGSTAKAVFDELNRRTHYQLRFKEDSIMRLAKSKGARLRSKGAC